MTKVFLTFIICCHCAYICAQPSTVTLSSCGDARYNGIYNDSGLQKTGAPCYQLATDPLMTLELTAGGWMLATYIAPLIPCDDPPFAAVLYSTSTNQDVSSVPSNGPMCGASARVVPTPPAAIPTMSQWACIILSLIMLVISTVAAKASSATVLGTAYRH